MSNKNSIFTLNILAAALMAAYGPANAAEMDEETKQIAVPSSSVSLGVGGWSDDRPQMGMNDGMRDDGAYLLLDANINSRDDATGTWKTLSIHNLGLDTREIRGEYLEQGNQGISLEYNQFKNEAPYTINTNQLGIGTATQTTGANIPNTAIGSGSNYQFGVEREKFGLGGYKNLMPGLDIKVNFSTEQKDGNRITSNGSALFVADLIDWTTNQLEAVLNYKGKNLQLSGGYNGSWFKNNNSLGYVALGSTLMTQPLDNQAHQGFLSGSYKFTPTTVGNFKVAYTHATQNEALPTASIPSNSYGAVPSLQGAINTTLVQLGLTAKPMPKLGLVANLRYYDSQDDTPQYTTVTQSDGVGTIDLNTTPYSYTTTSGKLEANYDLTQGYTAIAGIDYSKQDRTVYTSFDGVPNSYRTYVPYRAELDETTYRIQLRKSLSETLNGSIAYLYGDRGGSGMTSDNTINPRDGTLVVSPVHIADRERQKVRLALDWAPTDRLGVQLNLETAKDQYGTRVKNQGVHEGTADLYSIDVSYQLNDKWQLTGWYSYNLTNTHLINWASAINQKIGQQEDTGNAVGLHLAGSVNEKTRVGAEISWSRDESDFGQSYSDGSALAQVPDITSELTRIKLFTVYALKKNADLRFDLIHERWKTDDWQWMYSTGLPWQFGTATDGTTVLADPKQNATMLGVRYTYKFQ